MIRKAARWVQIRRAYFSGSVCPLSMVPHLVLFFFSARSVFDDERAWIVSAPNKADVDGEWHLFCPTTYSNQSLFLCVWWCIFCVCIYMYALSAYSYSYIITPSHIYVCALYILNGRKAHSRCEQERKRYTRAATSRLIYVRISIFLWNLSNYNIVRSFEWPHLFQPLALSHDWPRVSCITRAFSVDSIHIIASWRTSSW